MDCFVPGRVVVGPQRDSESAQLAEVLIKEFGSDFAFEYGIDDVVKKNDLDLKRIPRAFSLPFVGHVPEGAEENMAARIARFRKAAVGAASPDYLVRPAAPVSIAIDEPLLKQTLNDLRGGPGSPNCGEGARVAIVDSGIDVSLLPKAKVYPRQLDAVSPTGAGSPPNDQLGHGSLVARIVSGVAPGAELVSIRAFSQTGTISSVLAGLYLAQAEACDVVNLSFSISCAPDLCSVCGTPGVAATNVAQLDFFFRSFINGAADMVLVAAAGNSVQHVALPAAFDKVIAVGSFDYKTSAPISKYNHVPASRFVLAPGGHAVSGSAFGQRIGFSKLEFLYGTSFAAGFVSGFAAKIKCARSSSCPTPLLSVATNGSASNFDAVLAEINARADRAWPGYLLSLHGLGALYVS